MNNLNKELWWLTKLLSWSMVVWLFKPLTDLIKTILSACLFGLRFVLVCLYVLFRTPFGLFLLILSGISYLIHDQIVYFLFSGPKMLSVIIALLLYIGIPTGLVAILMRLWFEIEDSWEKVFKD